MREIKFRAWDIKYNKMLEVVSVGKYHVTLSPEYNDDEGNYNYELQHTKYRDGSGDIEVEVMQFTGLYDKHGKEIYESDIVKGEIGEIGIVIFLCWLAFCGFTVKPNIGHSFFNMNGIWNKIEVIGNIYENKEI